MLPTRASFTRGRSLVRSQVRPLRNPLETAGFSLRARDRTRPGRGVGESIGELRGSDPRTSLSKGRTRVPPNAVPALSLSTNSETELAHQDQERLPGRIMRRQGDAVAALLLFEQAYEAALASGDHYI